MPGHLQPVPDDQPPPDLPSWQLAVAYIADLLGVDVRWACPDDVRRALGGDQ